MRQARPAEATREFVRILQLHARSTPEVIAAALERAAALHCWSADGVEQCVRQALAPPPPSAALDLAAAPGLAALGQVRIPLPDLDRFKQLLTEVPA